jgi:hypothetical protein
MHKAADKPLHGSRILVAEDDVLIAFEIVTTLRVAGAEVLGPALSLARALELAATERFDLPSLT